MPFRFESACEGGQTCESPEADFLASSFYYYAGDVPIEDDLDGVIALLGDVKPFQLNVCFVGSIDSHSKQMHYPGDWLNIDLLGHVRFYFIESNRSSEFNVSAVDAKACAYVILGYGEEAFVG